ncbi:hypothetical protein LTR97_000966 [Elasticomyces elasticus]|uniref:Uncharacterized protein n=1 Tax=Elasticomyces elasticus TaxID=574655 RepID=A0AAN8A5U4_9PEZI|nr:hypothetical protein LTR97_000966 [Elasticomyces elasticus]
MDAHRLTPVNASAARKATFMSLPEELILDILSITATLTFSVGLPARCRRERDSSQLYSIWQYNTAVNHAYHRIAYDAFLDTYWHEVHLCSLNNGMRMASMQSQQIESRSTPSFREARNLTVYTHTDFFLEWEPLTVAVALSECGQLIACYPEVRQLKFVLKTNQTGINNAVMQFWDDLLARRRDGRLALRQKVMLYVTNPRGRSIRSVYRTEAPRMQWYPHVHTPRIVYTTQPAVTGTAMPLLSRMSAEFLVVVDRLLAYRVIRTAVYIAAISAMLIGLMMLPVAVLVWATTEIAGCGQSLFNWLATTRRGFLR